MKNYYLGLVKTLFVDPHGEADDGGNILFTAETDFEIDVDLTFKEEIHNEDYLEIMADEEWREDYVLDDDTEYEGSEDGYNMSYTEVTYKKITKKDYHSFNKTLSDYEQLEIFMDCYDGDDEDDEED